MTNDKDFITTERDKLLNSLLYFTQVFFKLRTGRDYVVSNPVGRESHHIAICRVLVKVFKGETKKLLISVPPRYGKSELIIHFIAWTMAWFPNSQYIYACCTQTLAQHQAAFVRDIINMSEYKELFGIKLNTDTTAKNDFSTNKKGTVYAVGAGGTIVGRGCGLYNADVFGGVLIIDDAHKPEESTSDTIRTGIIDWYFNSAQCRRNDAENTPVIIIGHITHEEDLIGHLSKNPEWEYIRLPALDEANNALDPSKHTTEQLLKMKDERPYEFASLYQQDPIPAGGAVFKAAWFPVLDIEPNILASFITVDTAETDKTYNDATAFSLWGVYKIHIKELETDTYALHWMDCEEIWIESMDLEDAFIQFYMRAMRHDIKPSCIAIEKKSTGVTLVSSLSKMQGVQILPMERSYSRWKDLGPSSKPARFLACQPYIARSQISLPAYAKHTKMCIEHCAKITLNDSHRYDDIADTMADAIKLALIDETIISLYVNNNSSKQNVIVRNVLQDFNELKKLRADRWK